MSRNHATTAPTPAPEVTPRPPTPRSPRALKIQDRHLERLAVVYVRQSSPQQVVDHQESRARQYALGDYAVTLGWTKDRVLVIDEDQGQSGRSVDQRDGFQRLLTEVTLGHVGLVLGLEMSRLARSSKDWHNLLELCALFGTLLGDQDGVYNPNDTNDRLLLGLKGTMSEYETFTMRNRLQCGRLHKAQRGELYIAVPCGYSKTSAGQVIQEPDEQARAVVHLVFDKFEELGSQYAVFRYLIDHNLRLGVRLRSGARRGELEWRRPCMATVAQILHHPIYAGAYVFGWRPAQRKGEAARHRRWAAMEEWQVLKRDHLPAYISWDQYLANQQRMQANRNQPTSAGTPRRGSALLPGLLVCGTCGRRMQPSYGSKLQPVYGCKWHLMEARVKTCRSVNAAVIDSLLSQQVLRALEPAALELSLQAEHDIHEDRQRLHRHWDQQLERARYEVERAERQYHAVEPENRLVVRTLEQRWEEALRQQQLLREEYDRFQQEQPAQLGEHERGRVRALAEDLPALWHSPATSVVERKEIIRCLVEKVVAHVQKDSEYVDVQIHWQGGCVTQHQVVRPVARYVWLRDFERLRQRLVELCQEGLTSAAMAQRLNEEGFSPPKRSGSFSNESVRQLVHRLDLLSEKPEPALGADEWWLSVLAGKLGIPAKKLRGWVARGWLHGRQTPGQHQWIVWADRDEVRRLRKLVARSTRGVTSQPRELTTPKCRT